MKNTEIPQFLVDLGVTKIQTTSYSWFDEKIEKESKLVVKYFDISQTGNKHRHYKIVHFNYVDYYIKNHDKWELVDTLPYECDKITETFDIEKYMSFNSVWLKSNLKQWQKEKFKLLTQGFYIKSNSPENHELFVKYNEEVVSFYCKYTSDIDGNYVSVHHTYELYKKNKSLEILKSKINESKNLDFKDVIKYLEENYKKIIESHMFTIDNLTEQVEKQEKQEKIQQLLAPRLVTKKLKSEIQLDFVLKNWVGRIWYVANFLIVGEYGKNVGLDKYGNHGEFEQFADVYFTDGNIMKKIDTIDLTKLSRDGLKFSGLDTPEYVFEKMVSRDFSKRFDLDEKFDPYLIKSDLLNQS